MYTRACEESSSLNCNVGVQGRQPPPPEIFSVFLSKGKEVKRERKKQGKAIGGGVDIFLNRVKYF